MKQAEESTSTGAARSIRGLLGSLVAVPLVAAGLGSQWSWSERIDAKTARIGFGDEMATTDAAPLVRLADGAESASGLQLPPRAFVEVDLPRALSKLSIELQADASSSFLVTAPVARGEADLLWTALGTEGARGLVTRRSSPLRLTQPVSSLRITPSVKREPTAISGVLVVTPRVSFPHGALVLLPWIVWLALWRCRGRATSGRVCVGALAAWGRADPWLATAVIYAILFRIAPPGLAGTAAGVAILGSVVALRRSPVASASVLASLVLCALVLPRALTAVATAAIGDQYDLTVDHRLKPNGDNINSDGIRSPAEADAARPEDFVVVFMGDSFTFGSGLRRYEATYPAVFEATLNARDCPTHVRAVNFGWPSASPLLGLRQLRQIGRKYRPDLVVYSLDTTDFHDDLRYERALRSAGEFEVDTGQLLLQLANRVVPWLDLDLVDSIGFAEILRPQAARDVGAAAAIPGDRFFVTSLPLEESRAWIEAGVMKNLAAIHDYAQDELNAPMLLVLYPRAYQYSDEESPRNWERSAYEELGPFVREPFRYFDEVRGLLPYPVIDLMPAFEAARGERLFFASDPHWNPRGARLAATAVARAQIVGDLIPCANR